MRIHVLLSNRDRSQKGPPLSAIRDLMGASRYASAWLEQLPLQPLMTALTLAFALGAIPMMLTVLMSMVRAVWAWSRHAFVDLSGAAPVGTRLVSSIPFKEFINHVELL
jgi:hypothetical protein